VSTLWSNATRSDRAQLALAVLLAVLLGVGYEIQASRGGSRPSPVPPGVSLANPEVKLVAIQLGHQPGPHNGFLAQFSGQLDILVTDCPGDTRASLVDMTLRARRELTRSGIPATPNQVLGGVVGAPALSSTSHCASIFAYYVAKRRRQEAATR
jgi:hypothetical protein